MRLPDMVMTDDENGAVAAFAAVRMLVMHSAVWGRKEMNVEAGVKTCFTFGLGRHFAAAEDLSAAQTEMILPSSLPLTTTVSIDSRAMNVSEDVQSMVKARSSQMQRGVCLVLVENVYRNGAYSKVGRQLQWTA